MLYREKIEVCFRIHTKHINTLCGQSAEFLMPNLALRILTSRPLFLLKGLVADVTNSPQPRRLIVQPYEEDDGIFSAFPF
jgi:hypothetical protein